MITETAVNLNEEIRAVQERFDWTDPMLISMLIAYIDATKHGFTESFKEYAEYICSPLGVALTTLGTMK